MSRYKTKVVEVTAYQLNNDPKLLSEIIRKLDAQIFLNVPDAIYDGHIHKKDWLRHFTFGEWLVFYAPDDTPVIMWDEDFKEQFEQI